MNDSTWVRGWQRTRTFAARASSLFLYGSAGPTPDARASLRRLLLGWLSLLAPALFLAAVHYGHVGWVNNHTSRVVGPVSFSLASGGCTTRPIEPGASAGCFFFGRRKGDHDGDYTWSMSGPLPSERRVGSCGYVSGAEPYVDGIVRIEDNTEPCTNLVRLPRRIVNAQLGALFLVCLALWKATYALLLRPRGGQT